MANTFSVKRSKDIGNTLTSVGSYTVADNTGAVIVGLSVSNTAATPVYANVVIDNGIDNFYIVNRANVPAHSSLVAVGGEQKIILQAGDTVKVNSSTASSVDVIMNIMESTDVGVTDYSFTFNKTISTNTENYNLKTDAMTAGWDGSSPLIASVTIDSNVYIWSSNTSVPGFDASDIPGTSTISIVNNGYIIGKGGMGSGNVMFTSGDGGNAIAISSNVTITNNSYIAAGGGGGGGYTESGGGGGGAGGGESDDGITGGTVGQLGNTGNLASSGASGGRILPGTGGASVQVQATSSLGAYQDAGNPGGSGSSGGVTLVVQSAQSGRRSYFSYAGGGGGGWGASGGTGYFSALSNIPTQPITAASGDGGSANISGSSASVAGGGGVTISGGAGGRAVALNGYSVTWAATGTRYGAIS